MIVDGYVRVSQVAGRSGESFISPAVQREQIEAWAKLTGATIGEIFEELDESGGRPDRPKLIEALERAERGESGGIVVAKLDRFGRSLVDGLANIERLSAAGAVFISIQDGLDLSTPTGKLVIRIMLSMAEWELDRIRDNWQVARARAVARGVHPSSAPIGYRRGGDGRLVPQEPAAGVIAEVFRRRAEGETLRSLLERLNAGGLRTARDSGAFVEGSLRGILANRTYLGEVRCGALVNGRAHPPLVDKATWQLAQRPLRFQSNRRTSLLGGLLRCGSCRMKMSVESGVFRHGTHGSVYRCPGRTSAGPCPAPARVRGEEIEGLVEDLVLAAPSPRRSSPSRRTASAAEKLRVAEAALERYRDGAGAVTVLSPESFAKGLAVRQTRLEAAAVALASCRQGEAGAQATDPGLEKRWPALSIEERRRAIEDRLDCIFVSAGGEPITARAYVFARGAGPGDLPRRGAPIGELRPFEPRAIPGGTRLRRPRRWAPRRIEVELRSWRGEASVWPTYVEFLLAGRARLHHQVLAFGGTGYWSRRLAWTGPPRTTRWDPETIRDGLRPILAGRREWPSAREFDALGLGGLRRAVIRHGGIRHWSAELGLIARPGTGKNAPRGGQAAGTDGAPGSTT